MSKKFEEQDGNKKHDEIAGAQSGNDCAEARHHGSVPWCNVENGSSESGAH